MFLQIRSQYAKSVFEYSLMHQYLNNAISWKSMLLKGAFWKYVLSRAEGNFF